jgi:hypothetical protein
MRRANFLDDMRVPMKVMSMPPGAIDRVALAMPPQEED